MLHLPQPEGHRGCRTARSHRPAGLGTMVLQVRQGARTCRIMDVCCSSKDAASATACADALLSAAAPKAALSACMVASSSALVSCRVRQTFGACPAWR